MDRTLIRKAIARPGEAVHYAMGMLRGRFYRWYLPLRGYRFTAGRNFRVYGRLFLHGPGRVALGDGVTVWGWVTPYTHDRDAEIVVGDRTVLSGTRFGCTTRIAVGDDCILADCRIFDTDFHSIGIDRHADDARIRRRPVTIGTNVWIASQAALMPGTTIGDNSVVGFAAVCSGGFPANVVVVGNPARIGGRVPGPDGRRTPLADSAAHESGPSVNPVGGVADRPVTPPVTSAPRAD